MAMNRRELVAMGMAASGMALAARGAEGQDRAGDGAEAPGQIRGRVVLYSEGEGAYFALSNMPEGVEILWLDSRYAERLGRVLLLAADKGWEVEATYPRSPASPAGPVYRVTIHGLHAG